MSSPSKRRKEEPPMLDPEKRKRKKEEPSPTPQWCPFLSLPNDLLLNCVARVSRLYYPTLSLVCKSFRSLLASLELYQARSLLGLTEICLYVCIRYGTGSRWYTLCRKPDKFLHDTKSKSSGYVLARVPSADSTTRADFGGLVAVGSSIYKIDKYVASNVSVLDCRTHTWREAPSFPVKLLSSASASVVDQKIYVAGRYQDGDWDSLVQLFMVFDPKTQTWDPLRAVPSTGGYYDVYGTACIDGKFHTVTTSQVDLAYNSKEGRWDVFTSEMREFMFAKSYCVIDNVLYSASHGNFGWYDYEVHEWKNLNGLDGLPKLGPGDRIGLAGYGGGGGGKMVVFWKEKIPIGFINIHNYNTKIWCTEISLERRSCGEIWGKVEWFDHVLTFPRNIDLNKVLAATL